MENPKVELDLINENIDLKMSETYIWVETELQLKELVTILSKERVFAVDTEQHSLRSFLGFTALIQVNIEALLNSKVLIIIIIIIIMYEILLF